MRSNRMVAWTILQALLGLYCLGFSLIELFVFQSVNDGSAKQITGFIRHLQPALCFPFFLVSLAPRRWAPIPLVCLCISILVYPYLFADSQMREYLSSQETSYLLFRAARESLPVLVMAVATLTAALLRPRRD